MNKKAELAWELYLKMDTSTESFNLLQLIANACYKVGEFWYAAKAFDMLERMDPSPEHWEGKRGACCGTFQYIIAEKQPKYVRVCAVITISIRRTDVDRSREWRIHDSRIICIVVSRRELLSDVIQLLKSTSNSQVEQIIRVMRKWGKDNRVNC